MNKKAWMFALLGGAVSFGAVWLIRKQKRQQAQRQPPCLFVWRQFLENQRGAIEAHKIVEATQRKYAALLSDCERPAHPVLRRHIREHILPGLALYRVLLEENGGDRQAALAEIDEIFRAWTMESVQQQYGEILALPIPFRLFKFAAGLQMKVYPPDGWDITYVENSDSQLAFNITRCFYLDTLTALDAPELTAAFCKMDDGMAELFPKTVRFVRPHTLGRGDALCDFQYCRGELSRPLFSIAKTGMRAGGTTVLEGDEKTVSFQKESRAAQYPSPNQGLYHQFAPLYDLLFDATYAGARRRAVALLECKPGERLLISGLGTGLDLPHIPGGVSVAGIDLSSEMLREAAKKHSPANVALLQMDAQRLNFSNESFDAALLNLIVSVAPDGSAVFQEAWRVLKPGGRLVLFDKFLPERQPLTLPRAWLGRFTRWIGTDINRRLSDIIGNLGLEAIEVDEPSLFFGQYRILRLRKRVS